jgi:glycosyltransferase involved in cell wall biosynthesis
LADFRDPLTTIGYHKELKLTKRSRKKHKVLESKVLNNADHVITTSFTTSKEFKKITKTPITVITNGYDKESVTDLEMDSKFTLAHIGSLLSQRNPLNLWKALSELIKENDDFAKDFQLNLIGLVSDEVINTIQYFGLSKYFDKIGYVSHIEAITYQKKSQVLLLIEINSEETKCIIPGKLFEYMVSNRPIISLGPEGSDVEKIIKETNTGNYFLYDDFDVLKNTILKHYKAFKMGQLQSHPIGLQKYSRKELTKLLAELI